jgi:hypothetical protein
MGINLAEFEQWFRPMIGQQILNTPRIPRFKDSNVMAEKNQLRGKPTQEVSIAVVPIGD